MGTWNLYQRLAVLVALGVVLHVSCQAILVGEAGGEWFAHPAAEQMLRSPLAGARYSPIVEILVFALHVGAWTVAALWLLRDRPKD